jgi:hypothetical protein
VTTATTIPVRLQLRQDTAANWTSVNPTLLAGELGRESDTGKIKIGNGSSTWTALAYLPGSELSAYPIVNADIAAGAAIALSKLATGALPTAITVASANIVDGTIVDADVNASAAIAGTKIVQGSTSVRGTVQLEDSFTSTSTTTAATPAAVKAAYDLADAALPKAGGVLTGDVTLNAQSDLRFADADSSNYVGFQAPATVSSDVLWTLPAADGSIGQVLSTNGTGTLDWTTSSVGGLIAETKQVIDFDYTLTAGFNGVSAGPVEVAATYTVTVPAGATWVIV